MKRTLFPGYSVGTDAYDDIKEICPSYGKKAAIIGGRHALAAAQDKIIAAAKEAGIETVGPFWYGGEASVENIEMLKPKVADADMIFAFYIIRTEACASILFQRYRRSTSSLTRG